MRKKILFGLLAGVLVLGYFVGSSFFSSTSSGRKSSSGGYALDSVGGEHDVIAARKRVHTDSLYDTNKSHDGSSSDVFVPECGPTMDCEVPQESLPLPEPGNPKGTKIVKSARISVVVGKGKVQKGYDDVVKSIPEGGYIEGTSATINSSSLTIRVPSDKLDSTLANIRKLGLVVDSSMNSADRTFDSIDYDARLKIMREREDVLNKQLQEAKTPYEAQNIQDQIFGLRSEIESLQGQKDFLDSQVALSTLNVDVLETNKGYEVDQDRPMLAAAWEKSAHTFLASVGGLMIVTIALFPYLVLVGVLVFFIRKALRNRADKKKESEVKENGSVVKD